MQLCFDRRKGRKQMLTGAGGVPSGRNRLAGYFWNETGTQGLVVLVHGMGTDVAYYLPEIHHFSAQGYRVFAFEYSGYQGSAGRFFRVSADRN